MGLSTLPPLKAVRIPSILAPHHHHHQQQQQKKKHRTSRHHYLLRMKKEECLRMRRLGSGLLEHDMLDSSILTHLVSLLDSERGGPFVLGGVDLQELDIRSNVSDHSALSRASSLPARGTKAFTGRPTSRGTCTTSADEGGRESPEEAPLTTSRDMSTASSSLSSVPQLPPISRHQQPLSPIKDVSRETSQLLPFPALRKEGMEQGAMPSVQVMPATPQHSTLTSLPHVRPRHHSQTDTDQCASEASGYNLSSDSSVAADPSLVFGQRSGRKAKTRGAKGKHGGKGQAWGSTEPPTLRGSMIMAPDGEIIQVGGSIVPPRQHDVGILSDVISPLRHYDGGMLTDDSGLSDEEAEDWRAVGRGRKPGTVRNKTVSKGGGPSVTEQDIVDTLTDQAKRIADMLLEKDGAGQDLERDVRDAADMWMETHPARDISSHHSGQDALKTEALEDLMEAYRASSADPTAAEYRDLIRQSLTTAVAKAAGLNAEEIPEDLEISPDLLEALANQKLSPDDVIIVHDPDTGRPVIRSRQGIASQAGTEDGHHSLATDGRELGGNMDDTSPMENKAGNIGQAEEYGSQISGASPRAEYNQKEAGIGAGTLAEAGDRTRANKTLAPAELPFLAGVADVKADLSKTVEAPPALPVDGKSKKEGKKRVKKGKKGRREEESSQETEGDSTPPVSLRKGRAAAVSTSDEPLSPKSASSSSERGLQSSPDPDKSEEDRVFPTVEREKEVKEPPSPPKPSVPLPFPEDDDDDDDEDEEDDDIEEKSLAIREARAARRAAAAAKRKEEVERRRREREEQLKLSKGEQERQEQFKQEMEMERLRKEEERRLWKLQEEQDADREARELQEEEKRRTLEEEKERKAKEELQRKVEEMRREQMEEESRKRALQLERGREEEERRAQEELMLSQMAEQERLEYERRKRVEEAAKTRQQQEERRRREEEAQKAMEEARRLAEEMARKQAALEAKLKFNRSLRAEARNLGHSQDINRAFVFSYFQLLQWLGLDIPQFEMAKMGRY